MSERFNIQRFVKRHKKTVAKVIFVFTLILVCFVYLDSSQLQNFIVNKAGPSKIGTLLTIAWAACYLSIVASYTLLFIVKSRPIRILSYIFTFFTLLVCFSTKITHAEYFGIGEANTILEEFQWAKEAFRAYYINYLYAGAGSIIFIAAIIKLIRVVNIPRVNSKVAMLFPLFCGIATIITFRTNAYVTPFSPLVDVPLLTAYASTTMPHFGKRNNVLFMAAEKPKAKHIVLIIDETVRGDLLQINNDTLTNTPFLSSIKETYLNFGIAASSSNTSRASNMIMMSGLTPQQLPDVNHKYASNPNIFQYAQQAGYKTYYVDGQNTADNPQNNMTKYDFMSIDHYRQIFKIFPNIETYESDYKITDQIENILKSDSNTFTYVIKYGCHFSYQNRYPISQEIYAPAYANNDVYTDRGTALNTYYNAISWSVDGFFKELLPKIEDKEVLIIYVSDHGESIMEQGDFCGHFQSIDPPNEQANIPFLIFEFGLDSTSIVQNLRDNQKVNNNKLSQFQVFPTCLYLMGYEKSKVNLIYGPTIIDAPIYPRTFLSGVIYYPEYTYINVYDNN